MSESTRMQQQLDELVFKIRHSDSKRNLQAAEERLQARRQTAQHAELTHSASMASSMHAARTSQPSRGLTSSVSASLLYPRRPSARGLHLQELGDVEDEEDDEEDRSHRRGVMSSGSVGSFASLGSFGGSMTGLGTLHAVRESPEYGASSVGDGTHNRTLSAMSEAVGRPSDGLGALDGIGMELDELAALSPGSVRTFLHSRVRSRASLSPMKGVEVAEEEEDEQQEEEAPAFAGIPFGRAQPEAGPKPPVVPINPSKFDRAVADKLVNLQQLTDLAAPDELEALRKELEGHPHDTEPLVLRLWSEWKNAQGLAAQHETRAHEMQVQRDELHYRVQQLEAQLHTRLAVENSLQQQLEEQHKTNDALRRVASEAEKRRVSAEEEAAKRVLDCELLVSEHKKVASQMDLLERRCEHLDAELQIFKNQLDMDEVESVEETVEEEESVTEDEPVVVKTRRRPKKVFKTGATSPSLMSKKKPRKLRLKLKPRPKKKKQTTTPKRKKTTKKKTKGKDKEPFVLAGTKPKRKVRKVKSSARSESEREETDWSCSTSSSRPSRRAGGGGGEVLRARVTTLQEQQRELLAELAELRAVHQNVASIAARSERDNRVLRRNLATSVKRLVKAQGTQRMSDTSPKKSDSYVGLYVQRQQAEEARRRAEQERAHAQEKEDDAVLGARS